MSARLLDAGDGAVTIEFGATVAPELVARVAAFEHTIDGARARGELAGVIETVPTFRSLTVIYDPLVTGRATLDPVLRALLGRGPAEQAQQPRHNHPEELNVALRKLLEAKDAAVRAALS